MKRFGHILMATTLLLSVSAVTLGGTITGSRTSRTGTITGSRTGTITGSRTGTITGSRHGTITGSAFVPDQPINERNRLSDEWVTRMLIFVLNLYL
ncbi:MAG TPA: hypothetical protein VFD48_00925 [Pyrinomonadaceae bacterium]|nr:hypothetical protein [Pyrinomonadaceae bacterium]